MKLGKLFSSFLVLALLLALMPAQFVNAAEPGDVVINEIMQNPAAVSDANGEWFEVFNPTANAFDLDGWTIKDNDTDNHVINNGGPLVVPAGGYLVLARNGDSATNGGVVVDYVYSGIDLANSSDELVLLDTSMNEIDRVEWNDGATFPDPNGASMELSDPTLDNNVGANWCTATTSYGDGDFGTPGAENDCSSSPPPPPSDFVSIHDIQYTTDPSGDSPYAGQTVTTEGIVTGFFYDGGNKYTFIQDGTGPWSGLVLYKPNAFINVGDKLQVHGQVSEYSGLTEISYGIATVLSSGNPLPMPEVMTTGAVSQEQWESVFVRVEYATVTNDSLGYGEWLVDDDSGGVRVDDLGSYGYSPSNGDLMAYVQGPLYFSFSDFKIEPRDDNDIKLSVCGNAYTPVYTIQGNSAASPLVGTTVDVEGVVTGDYQDGKSGFFMQDATGDGDASTSDGIFVYAPSPDINEGDLVHVTGKVSEYFDLTELSANDLEVCSTGNTVAATPLSLPVTSVDDFEAYEGMLVTFPDTLYISEYYAFGQYGEIVLTTDRQFQPTAVYDPGSPEAAQLADENPLNRIKLDDGRSSQNPDPARHPDGGVFELGHLFRGGDTLDNVIGVMDYNYGEYKIQPTEGADYTEANPRPETPDDVGGNLKVASFNVLNYFTTIDDGSDNCGPLQDQECRGADTEEEFTRQRDKIIAALSKMDADVVGLIEIENNPGDVPTADLVSGLNDVMGAGTYDYIATGWFGTDAIRQAFIYKPATVSPVGAYAVLDDPAFTNPLGYDEEKSRPALAQTFMDNETGGVFTAVVNHLKSKGSSCGEGDDDPEAGSCNLTRTLAAQELVSWLSSDPTGIGDGDYLIIGDLNSYDKEDPIDVLLAGGFADLVKQYQGEFAYSYVFDGQLGYLDHALANANFAEQITGVTIWHINADEPSLIDYDMTYKKPAQDAIYAPDAYRSSDHDPVIIGIDMTAEQVKELIDDVQALVDDGSLNDGQGNALTSKLENVLAKLAKGNTNAAANQLGAFINQVEAYVNGGILTSEQAEPLITSASLLVEFLSK